MVTLEWDLERTGGVTLVRLFVRSERRCRVRIENRLDGPVWPPRRRGRPASGWDDGVFTGTVPADGRLTVGYATPAATAEPPAEVVETTAAGAAEPLAGPGSGEQPSGTAREGGRTVDGVGSDERAGSDVPSVEPTPDGVIRSLGDPVVPRDCVPVPAANGDGTENGNGDGTANPVRDGTANPVRDGTGIEPPADDAGTGRHARRRSGTADDETAGGRTDGRPLVVPGAVRSWFRDVERRLDAVENGTAGGREATGDGGATSDRGATAGGPPVEDLAAAVEADRRALSWVGQRAEALATRAASGEGR